MYFNETNIYNFIDNLNDRVKYMSLFHFRCSNPHCNWSIVTEPYGHFTVERQHYYLFCCYNCRDIQTLSCEDIAKLSFMLGCDKCGKDIFTWNPVDGNCPKCKHPLIKENI